MFAPDVAREREYQRRLFWQALVAKPPAVIVVASESCGKIENNDYDYAKLPRWPAFNSYLQANYVLYAERIPPSLIHWARDPGIPVGYRIYVRSDYRPE
jgi:hypothetical protein